MLHGLGGKQISKESFIVTGSQLTCPLFLAPCAELSLIWVADSFLPDGMGGVA